MVAKNRQSYQRRLDIKSYRPSEQPREPERANQRISGADTRGLFSRAIPNMAWDADPHEAPVIRETKHPSARESGQSRQKGGNNPRRPGNDARYAGRAQISIPGLRSGVRAEIPPEGPNFGALSETRP